MGDIVLIKGLGAIKSLGQNFLIDKNYIERELSHCKPQGKTVLEIGPGIGALTAGLAKEAKGFTAIEIDERFIPILTEKLRGLKNASVVYGDALEFAGGPFDLVVSNVPYCVASKLVLKIPEFGNEAVICIQKELAHRMAAKPGSRDYSRFSVMCQLLFEVELLEKVPAGAFYPKPEVESRVLRLRVKGKVDGGLSLFINAIFQHRNKKLRNAVVDSRELLGLGSKEKAVEVSGRLALCERRVITLTKEEVTQAYGEFREAIGQPAPVSYPRQ